MIFSWLKRRRRRRLLSQPFPQEWHEILRQNFYHYARLTEQEQSKLRDDLRILIDEKHWEGCDGLELTDEIRVTIAAQASLLLLGFKQEYFDTVETILVYPAAYIASERVMIKGGVLLEGQAVRQGEAWYRGPVVLSWADCLASGRRQNNGDNLVVHEFTHQLDMENGELIDGTPFMSTRAQYDRWQQVIQPEFERLKFDCSQGQSTVLSCYGTKDLGEFFAVSAECFFERPRSMLRLHPELYELYQDYFQQDPAQSTEDAW